MSPIISRTRRPDIKVHANGRIDINKRTSQMIGLRHGDIINLLCDNGQWYLYICCKDILSAGRHAATCRQTSPRSRHVRAFSTLLSNALLQASSAKEVAGYFVGTPTLHQSFGVMLPIITNNPI